MHQWRRQYMINDGRRDGGISLICNQDLFFLFGLFFHLLFTILSELCRSKEKKKLSYVRDPGTTFCVVKFSVTQGLFFSSVFWKKTIWLLGKKKPTFSPSKKKSTHELIGNNEMKKNNTKTRTSVCFTGNVSSVDARPVLFCLITIFCYHWFCFYFFQFLFFVGVIEGILQHFLFYVKIFLFRNLLIRTGRHFG